MKTNLKNKKKKSKLHSTNKILAFATAHNRFKLQTWKRNTTMEIVFYIFFWLHHISSKISVFS